MRPIILIVRSVSFYYSLGATWQVKLRKTAIPWG